ncbi:MAG: 3D domain-containing protein [Pyrinomonadaceae bacterium]
MFRVSFIIIGALLFSISIVGQQLDKNGFGYAPPELDGAEKLSLWSTFYYVHEAKYAENGLPLNDANGNATGVKLANCDWCDAAIEGTVRTFDKTGKAVTLNYAKVSTEQQCDCQATCGKYANYKNKKIGYTLWATARGEFGDGVSGYKLVPFRTIAVDKAFIPIGTLIFVPQAVGVVVTLPNGDTAKHDGYFFAADVGGGIKTNHIDSFFGLKTKNPFKYVTSKPEDTFDAYIVKGSAVETALAKLHK